MKSSLLLAFCTAFCSGAAAAPFQNLGFDLANTNNMLPSPPQFGLGTGTQADMLPGWSLTAEEHELSWLVGLDIGLDSRLDGLGYATLVDQRLGFLPLDPRPSLFLPFEGRFSLALYAFDFPPVYIAYTLSQSGDVPADARTIQFLNYGEPFELRVNGTPLPLSYDYSLIDILEGTQQLRVANVLGDISAYAGTTVMLEFTTINEAEQPGQGFGSLVNGLDSIRFVVPEPGSLALLAVGGMTLWLARRRRR